MVYTNHENILQRKCPDLWYIVSFLDPPPERKVSGEYSTSSYLASYLGLFKILEKRACSGGLRQALDMDKHC